MAVINLQVPLQQKKKKKKKKEKLSLQQAVEVHSVVRRRGSHIFL
jgi:hypothetical protein